ncbi:MAG: hypothetical protein SGPRY_011352, partial [Prymnesium sp.]
KDLSPQSLRSSESSTHIGFDVMPTYPEISDKPTIESVSGFDGAARSRVDDATAQQLDDHLLAYLAAYQDFMTSQLELESALRDGHISLAQAKRELSRTRNTCTSQISSMQYPSEFQAVIGVQEHLMDDERCRHLCIQKMKGSCSPEWTPTRTNTDVAENEMSKTATHHLEEDLSKMRVAPEFREEIVEACSGDREIAVDSGDRLVVEGVGSLDVRSRISSVSGGLGGINASIFQAAVGGSRIQPASSSKPEQSVSHDRDPLRWFAMLPPLALRRAQKSFRRAVETSVQIANARSRMDHHRALYTELLASVGSGKC